MSDSAFQAFLQAKEYAEKIISDIIATWYLIVAYVTGPPHPFQIRAKVTNQTLRGQVRR